VVWSGIDSRFSDWLIDEWFVEEDAAVPGDVEFAGAGIFDGGA
jgi:hypothetical protein